jgi:hypothetical protein
VFLLFCTAAISFTATLLMNSSNADAVFWRGITAPTSIDIHGWPIIKGSLHSPCQCPAEWGLLGASVRALI